MKKVKMYTLSTCPWCKKTKKYFKDHHIPFEFIDYDLADKDQKNEIIAEMRENGANGFPFVKIKDEIVVGYKPDEYSRILGISS